MPPFKRHTLPSVLLLAAMLPGAALHAQGVDTPWPSALSAADPTTPVPATAPAMAAPPTALALTLPADMAQARALWQRANQRVAEFPRGHMDVLRWERQHTPDTTAAAPSATAPLTLADALRLSLRHRPHLFTQPSMNEVERGEVERAYINHVRDLQRAWTQAISTGQSLQLMAEVLGAANTGAELGARMVQAGSWSQAKLLREQQMQAQAWQSWAQAQQTDLAARERLARLMGEWAATAPERLTTQLANPLPAVPATLTPGPGLSSTDVEAAVLRSDPTLAWQRAQTQRALDAMGSGRLDAWRSAWAQAVAAPPHATATAAGTGTDTNTGAGQNPWPYTAPSITNLPLLRDHALARAVQAEAALLQRAAERRSMAREAWANLQAQHARALHAQNTVVSLSTRLEQETLTRYNGMLQSTWDLLASVRQRLQTLDAATQARRDHWLAQADWQALLAGGDYTAPGNSDASTGTSATAPQGH